MAIFMKPICLGSTGSRQLAAMADIEVISGHVGLLRIRLLIRISVVVDPYPCPYRQSSTVIWVEDHV